MCGIHIIILKNKELESKAETAIDFIVRHSAHRGPDGSALLRLNWTSETIWIGHNLLAITEQAERARQPIQSPDGKYGLVFNGYIYNHEELRYELQRQGVEFSTRSDSEVLFHWLRLFGKRGIAQLRGMFAFAFWNQEKEFLLIHRDGFGIKPLWYIRNRHFLAFSSSAAALRESGLQASPLNESVLKQIIQFKYAPCPASYAQGVNSVLPGETIVYFEGKPLHHSGEKRTYAALGIGSLKEALQRGFSEVIPVKTPVGLMLSGGVDSTLILSYCLDLGIAVEPFSIRFQYGFKEDLADQQAVEYLADLFQININWVDVGLDDMPAAFHFVVPSAPLILDGAWYLTDKIAQSVKERDIRVLLSGAGADEWFAGYRRHSFFFKWLHVQRFLPKALQKALVEKLAQKKIFTPSIGKVQASSMWEALCSQSLTALLGQASHGPMASVKTFSQALKNDQTQYLVQDVLTMTDLATMAHGIEGRFPFLHPFITSFAESMAAEEHIRYGRKHWLKKELPPSLKSHFLHRPKRGFGLPWKYWFTTAAGKDAAQELLADFPKVEIFKQDLWESFRKQAGKSPEKYDQELVALSWLRNWLKQEQVE